MYPICFHTIIIISFFLITYYCSDAYKNLGNNQTVGTLFLHGEVGCFTVAPYFAFSLSKSILLRLQVFEEATLFCKVPTLASPSLCHFTVDVKTIIEQSQDPKRCIQPPQTVLKAEYEKVIWLYFRKKRIYFQILWKDLHPLLLLK